MPRSRWSYWMPSSASSARMPCSVARLYSAMRTMARILGASRDGRHSRRKARPHCHWRQSSCGRNSSGASSWNIHFSSLNGACGLAQGSAYDTDICAPLARLVSCAAPVHRSTTTTSWPAWLSHQALETPMMPLPNTATFIPESLPGCGSDRRARPAHRGRMTGQYAGRQFTPARQARL
ncbi:Uncharacterised protein [Bordetella pertussis]|nr:Uncharacterised protein [Bordetella pertussis]